MEPKEHSRSVVLNTPWFRVISRQVPGCRDPHYIIETSDFASIVALNPGGDLLLVRQFRPALGMVTLELPSGHVDPGETPEEAARKELYEETGHEAESLELVATLSPSARFTNRLWVFYAAHIRPAPQTTYTRDSQVEFTFYSGGIRSLLQEKDFISAGSCASLLAAAARGKISI